MRGSNYVCLARKYRPQTFGPTEQERQEFVAHVNDLLEGASGLKLYSVADAVRQAALDRYDNAGNPAVLDRIFAWAFPVGRS